MGIINGFHSVSVDIWSGSRLDMFGMGGEVWKDSIKNFYDDSTDDNEEQDINNVCNIIRFTMTMGCNEGCNCSTTIFTPICSADTSTTYFSPCFAGCQQMNRATGTVSECSCLDTGGVATTGYCQSDDNNCDKLFTYLLIMGLGFIILCMATTGDTLLTLRTKYFIELYVNVHSVSVDTFGAVVDSTCLVWEEKCGK
ncbi:unnamed protein product, partial [Oppiella nova]